VARTSDRRARVDAAAAERGWVPDLRVVGGFKGTEIEPGARSLSLVLGVALALPLWGESSALAGIARGELLGAQGHRDLAFADALSALEAARTEALSLRSAAVEFAEQAQAAGDLVRIAAAGYAGGELGVLELLDAYRGEMDDALTRLDLAHQARRARLDFDRLTEVTSP
jgi:cobalt-zinc-cadmium efflux system outer membrane protein